MPGGRLTQQERRQIARGVAEGLPYAEIARSLDRPTSTVTREVTRNGGPAAYRAETAHRATEHRAHRRRGAGPRETRPAPQPYGRDADAVRAYEEVFTSMIMASGAPPMVSRVLACLSLTDSGSLTAAGLAGRLGVSPASVSKAITYLEGQGMIRRERDGGRRERYTVDDDIMYDSMMASARSTAELARTAREGAPVFGPGTPAGIRLENMARFLDHVSEAVARAAEQARDLLHTKPGTPPPDAPA
ncbi:helix-turn-helix domain-containing protein [Streptomyces castrisilvae]